MCAALLHASQSKCASNPSSSPIAANHSTSPATAAHSRLCAAARAGAGRFCLSIRLLSRSSKAAAARLFQALDAAHALLRVEEAAGAKDGGREEDQAVWTTLQGFQDLRRTYTT